jgi:SAM-dependent methyltransferase
MTHKCCGDERCLYRAGKNGPLKSSFQTVTRETREGDGLWEKCGRCGLVINRSGVPPEEAEKYYNDTYVKTNSYSKGEIMSAKAHFDARVNTLRPRADYLSKWLRPEHSVFELGAATGELLWLIKDKVKSCMANEVNQLYSEFIRTELKIGSSHTDYFKLKFPEKFDFILALNTIDHIYDTLGVVRKINADLKNGGYLYVECPNDAQALKTMLPEPQRSMFQKFMYQRAHYYSFTFDTLGKLLEDNGFNVIDEQSRHDYTLVNYLQWFFAGAPMKKLQTAKENPGLHAGDSGFERDMNAVFERSDKEFREIITKHRLGESLCVLAQKTSEITD